MAIVRPLGRPAPSYPPREKRLFVRARTGSKKKRLWRRAYRRFVNNGETVAIYVWEPGVMRVIKIRIGKLTPRGKQAPPGKHNAIRERIERERVYN